jgi:hypothetical protein
MPPCHGRNPGGVIDFSSIKASPVRGHAASKVPGRSTASTPRRRGHPGPAGGRAGRGEEDPAVQDADRRRDQAQGRPDSAPSMGRRADFRLDVPLPTPSPPVRADHSARSCSAATTQYRMPPRWICSTDFSQFPVPRPGDVDQVHTGTARASPRPARDHQDRLWTNAGMSLRLLWSHRRSERKL